MAEKTVYYVTSSDSKAEEAKRYLPQLKRKGEEYREIQALKVEEVVREASERLSQRWGQAVIVDDLGLYVESLQGFPGAFLKQFAQRAGPRRLLQLMEGEENREAYFEVSMAYCDPYHDSKAVTARRQGSIAYRVKTGPQNYGLNSVFVPEGKDRTLAQFNLEEKMKNEPRIRCLEKLVSRLDLD